MRPIPVDGRWQALRKRDPWPVSETLELRYVGAATFGAAGRRRPLDHLDIAPGMGSNPSGKISDRYLLPRPDMVNPEVIALRTHHHNARDEIVDLAEASGLAAIALEFERDSPLRVFGGGSLQSHRELRDHVLPAHVWSIDIVGAENQNALEIFCARN